MLVLTAGLGDRLLSINLLLSKYTSYLYFSLMSSNPGAPVPILDQPSGAYSSTLSCARAYES